MAKMYGLSEEMIPLIEKAETYLDLINAYNACEGKIIDENPNIPRMEESIVSLLIVILKDKGKLLAIDEIVCLFDDCAQNIAVNIRDLNRSDLAMIHEAIIEISDIETNKILKNLKSLVSGKQEKFIHYFEEFFYKNVNSIESKAGEMIKRLRNFNELMLVLGMQPKNIFINALRTKHAPYTALCKPYQALDLSYLIQMLKNINNQINNLNDTIKSSPEASAVELNKNIENLQENKKK